MNVKETTSKDFTSIDEDYLFFQSHTDEAEKAISFLSKEITALHPHSIMDFGAGDGAFLSKLIEKAELKKESLDISLVEISRPALDRSQKVIKEKDFQKVNRIVSLSEIDPELKFDLILSNHVLYYIKDLVSTLDALKARLKPGGSSIYIFSSEGNDLVKFWHNAFKILRISNPFHLPKEIESKITKSFTVNKKEVLKASLQFPDSFGNRKKIIRFLLGNYANHQLEDLSTLFDEFSKNSFIKMNLEDQVLTCEGNK